KAESMSRGRGQQPQTNCEALAHRNYMACDCRGATNDYGRAARWAMAFCNAWSREPRKIRIFTSVTTRCPGAREACGSTCWQVSSGLLQTFPVLRVKLATTHLRSFESVAMNG